MSRRPDQLCDPVREAPIQVRIVGDRRSFDEIARASQLFEIGAAEHDEANNEGPARTKEQDMPLLGKIWEV